MIKTIHILFILVFTTLFAQSNEPNFFVYQAYKFESSEAQRGELNRFLKQETDSIQFELQYENGMSYFYPVQKIDNSQEFKISLNNVFRKSQGEFYVNNQLQQTENLKEVNGQKVIITYDFDDLNWELTDKTEIINNRLCKIAVNRRYETGLKGPKEIVTVVWIDESFDRDIAPFGLGGLKGLVVKVNFNNNYETVLSEMSFRKNLNIKPFKAKTRMTLEEYYVGIYRINKERRDRSGGQLL